ncbi:MAG TPA: RsmB/NOP family class I SAM-dependent RNA methyltransferase [Caulobacteraceae bacterium]
MALDPVPALPARIAALALLESALSRRGGLDEALSAAAFLKLSPQDRAFARALTMAALRHLGPIDRALDGRLKKEPPGAVRNILRLGATQAFYLDTPAFAAVDTAVNLAPKPLRGLVNAVLRNLLRAGAIDDDPERLAPPWLFARWGAAYGPEEALAIASSIAQEPATDLTPRAALDDALIEALEATTLSGGSLRSGLRGDVASWPGYGEGRWWVQDAAAAIPARLMRATAGQSLADLCAAPGGKSLQLASAGARVVAVDQSGGRLRRLTAGLARTGLSAEIVASDVLQWRDGRLFDGVLLDAPCTATGAFRRNPDVLWNVRPGEIAPLAAVQSRLLDAAAARVGPGGLLIYAVCSLEAEEGEAQALRFLSARPDFVIDPVAIGEGGAPEASTTAQGWLRVLPHHLEGGMDGFFIARFRRAV